MVREMNKKGWLRIVETSIAVVMVLSSLIIIHNGINQRQEVALDDDFYSLLGKMAENNILRGEILSYDYSKSSNAAGNYQIMGDINSFLASEIPDRAINYSVSICSPLDNCNQEKNMTGEIYSVERIITTNLTNPIFSERKVRIYWGNG